MRVKSPALRPSSVKTMLLTALKSLARTRCGDELLKGVTVELCVLEVEDEDEESDETITGALLFPDGMEEVDTDNLKSWRLCIAPRENPSEILVMIAHEVIHLHQYLSKRTRVVQTAEGDITCWWDGKVVPNETPYMELPWEVQAYEEMDELVTTLQDDGDFLLSMLRVG